MFTGSHHFYLDRLTNNKASFTPHKEGESTPIGQATCSPRQRIVR